MNRLAEHEWVAEYPDTLELICQHLVATGLWPDPVALERKQRAINSRARVLEAVGRMPNQVGSRSHSPSEVRLSLAAIGSSRAGKPIVEAVFSMLEYARRRFADPALPPRIEVGELGEVGIASSLHAAVSRLVSDGGVIFLGGGSSGVEAWDLEISERIVLLDGCTDADSLIALLKVWYWQPRVSAPPEQSATTQSTPANPTVLVSYAQSSASWSGAILDFATVLRSFGIDAHIDAFYASAHQEWSIFGPRLIEKSDFTLIAIDEAYRRRWEGSEDKGVGAGVIREAAALKAILERDREEFVRKVKVVVLPGASTDDVPADLLGIAERFKVTSFDAVGLDALLRSLTGQPPHPMPPLGDLPLLPPKAITDLMRSDRAHDEQRGDADAPTAPARPGSQTPGPPSTESMAASSGPGNESELTQAEHRQRNVVEARALVEEAVVAAPELIQAQAGLRSIHNTRSDERDKVLEAMSAYVAARERMIAFDTRLILRLGFDHPVRRALGRLIHAVDSAGQDVIGLITFDEGPSADWLKQSEAERSDMLAAKDNLLVAASNWMRGA